MNQLEWARPYLWPWLLLAPLVWLGLYALLRAARQRAARYGAVLRERVPGAAARATWLTLAGTFLLLTAMEPLLGKERIAVERRGVDLVFCLDTSRSMLARDIEPSRLQRAKRDIKSVLPELQKGDRAALVAFAGKAKLVVPLTHDLDSFGYLLDEVDTDTVREGGSDLAAALRKALEVAEKKNETTTVILLLTDGEDLQGAGRQAASEVAARGVVLHAVGYGSSQGSKIVLSQDGKESFLKADGGDEVVSAMHADSLRAMAREAGGEFLRADVMALPLLELERKRIQPMQKRAYDAGEETLHKSRFQWVLWPALVLLLVELWRNGGGRR